jgi:sugar phosphate isomerase/epimerase
MHHAKQLLLSALLTVSAACAAPLDGKLGLQLWSLRHEFEADVTKGLDETQSFGFTLVETAGTYGLTPADFRGRLAAHGLGVVSAHFGYDRLKNDLSGVIADAKALGAEYVVLPWLPQTEFDPATAREVAPLFNQWGHALQAAGLKFAFHPHGYEFHPVPGGHGETAFDLLVGLTEPAVVSFEMDVFWIAHAGVDPVALLARYPDRWTLMHVKDMRTGAAIAGMRSAPQADQVAVGTGQLNWPAILRAAKSAGVKYYFIEDETVAPLQNIPVSLHYLQTINH